MGRITMAHGAGGEKMQELIRGYVLKHFKYEKTIGAVALEALDDSAVVDDIVFTTDSHTVKPLFFPGGDIGTLSVAGSINDVAVMGARPLALSAAFVIEEGFELDAYERILDSMRRVSADAGVPIVTGDTKVMEHGALDKLIINTSCIGRSDEVSTHNLSVVRKSREFDAEWITDSSLRPGDKLIISGSIADHGIALLSFREGYGFESEVQSDVAPLNKMIRAALSVGGVVAMKDPTRGGLANSLNEFAEKSGAGLLVEEAKIPVKEPVRAASEMLGIDPLEIGNEGKVLIGVVEDNAEHVLETLRATKEGRDAELIGACRADLSGVVMKTLVGGKRIVDLPIADPVPRIC